MALFALMTNVVVGVMPNATNEADPSPVVLFDTTDSCLHSQYELCDACHVHIIWPSRNATTLTGRVWKQSREFFSRKYGRGF